MTARAGHDHYPMIGTTALIYVSRIAVPKIIRPEETYFRIKICSAQAAFRGAFWDRAHRLIVTSQVSLNHPLLGPEPVRAIQRSREVERERAERLGLSPNLVNLVPATMTHVSVSIEFVLDKQNRLAALSGLINDDSFVAAVSLAPGAAPFARAISGISQKLLQTFLDPEDRRPILLFSGDFDIATGNVREGYYVILGTRDKRNPLPDPRSEIQVSDSGLLINGKPATQLCYIILEVQCLEARTRGLSTGANWELKLRQAEATAQRIQNDPFTNHEAKRQAWKECLNLIKEAQILLIADPNYLHREAINIIKGIFVDCRDQIFGEHVMRSTSQTTEQPFGQSDIQAALSFLDISSDESLETDLNRYATQVAEARHLINKEGII